MGLDVSFSQRDANVPDWKRTWIGRLGWPVVNHIRETHDFKGTLVTVCITREELKGVIEFCKKYNVETPDAPIPKYFIEDLSELYDKVKKLPKTKKCVDVFMSW